MKTRILLAAALLAGAQLVHAAENAGTPADWPMPMHVPGPYGMLLGDRLESAFTDGHESYAWDLQGWYGGDYQRLRFKTEGEGEHGESPEDAELQLLYSRLFAPYWEWQLGLRHDFEPGDGRSFAVAGIQGAAPYEFEVDAGLYLSEDGDLSLRFEAEYDLLLTQRLVLQPRLELDAALNDAREFGVARGLNGSELGLRLRYELRREFAPYVGLEWERAYGATAGLVRADGGDASEIAFVAGVRFWF